MNTHKKNDPLLVAIVGPTGSGKTTLALRLAAKLNGEIVSCDSVAVYREFEIGTAKPDRADRQRIPHHMIDVASPLVSFTAGEYGRQARAVLADIKSRNKMPIVVGGTGLYLRALIEGLFAGPLRSEDLRGRLHQRAQSRGQAYLHRLLRRMDSATAEKIHPNDKPKIIRAIEVCLAAREKMSELWKTGREPLKGFQVLCVGLDPDRRLLYDRINQRCQQMFDAGLLEETRLLLESYPQGLDIPNSPLNSLGYRQAVQSIHGEIDAVEAVAQAQQGHRNYAKRQLTWFRKDPAVHWIARFGDEDPTFHEVVQLVEHEMESEESPAKEI